MAIEKPLYTQTPNIMFDEYMKTLTGAETKVLFAIARKTFGFQAWDGKPIAQSTMQEMTGLSNKAVINALRKLEELDIIERGETSNFGTVCKIKFHGGEESTPPTCGGKKQVGEESSHVGGEESSHLKESSLKKVINNNDELSEEEKNQWFDALVYTFKTETGVVFKDNKESNPAIMRMIANKITQTDLKNAIAYKKEHSQAVGKIEWLETAAGVEHNKRLARDNHRGKPKRSELNVINYGALEYEKLLKEVQHE